MEINNIASYLAKFKNLQPSDAYIGEGLQKAVLKVVGEEVQKEQMKYAKGTMFLVVDASFKSEIFLHKKEILDEANMFIGKTILKNIV